MIIEFIYSFDCNENEFSSIDQLGPSLSVSNDILSKSFSCFNHGTNVGIGPILLIPGTGVEKGFDQYGYGWTKELNEMNVSYCLVDPPDYGLGDIQMSSEYIVYSIRQMNKYFNGKRIKIIAHSQGSASARWALRFWPDIRLKVQHLIGLAPANHAMNVNGNECRSEMGCIPARWQFLSHSQMMCALNSYEETFHEQIFYTQILTRYDEAIRPIDSSELQHGSNIYIQDICPNNSVTHLGLGIYDSIAYLIAMDALINNQSANLERIQRESCPNESCCQQIYLKSFNQSLLPSLFNEVFALNSFIENYPRVKEEPPLKCYVIKDCVVLFSHSSDTSLNIHLLILANFTLLYMFSIDKFERK